MNILYLATAYPFPGTNAGSTHVYNITKNIQKLGHEVHIVSRCRNMKDIGETREYNGLFVHYVDWSLSIKIPRFIPTSIKAILSIKNWREKCDFDIIQERFEIPSGISSTIGRVLKIPNIIEINDAGVEGIIPKRTLSYETFSLKIVGVIRKIQMDLSSAIITQTRLLKDIIASHTSTQISVIPNGADPSVFDPKIDSSSILSKYGLEDSDVIGFVGSFRSWHGVSDLIRSFKYVKEELPATKLMLIGGGDEFEENRGLTRRLGLSEDVIFTGSIGYDQIPRYLSATDVLVAPFNTNFDKRLRNSYERYGMWWSPVKIFEYMSMAKPVVCPKLGVIPEYIDGAGLTYKEGNIEELAEKIITLLQDEMLSKRLGQEGRKKVMNRYSWKIQAEKTIDIYKKILNGANQVY